MSKSHDKPWKVRERQVASFHGLVRNPLSGENSGRVGDAYDPENLIPWIFLEVKLRNAHSVISILRNHRKQVSKKHGGEALCGLALAENGKQGFYMMIHSEFILEYAVGILRRYGWKCEPPTKKEGEDVATSHPE